MANCNQCGAIYNSGAFCNACGAPQPANRSDAPLAPANHRLRNLLIVTGAAIVLSAVLVISRSVSAVGKANQKAQEVVRTVDATPARNVETSVLAASSAVDAEEGDAVHSSFPAWQSSTVPASPAPPRSGMLVVTAIEDPEGDYESMKQIHAIDADGITLTYHGAKPKENGQDIADVTRLVLTQDLDKSHDYAQLFGMSQPRSLPGTTAISASKEVFAELSQKGTSEFSFQPDGIKGAIGNMVNMLSAFGGVSKKDIGGDAELDRLAKERCTLKREGTGLFAFPVLLDDQPTTLPALRAGCSTDDGPAEFYILNQAEYPLMLAWKLGSGSQLQVTKISYPAAPAKFATAPASTHMEQQLEENKPVEIYGIYFDFGSDHLKPESTPVLKEIAAVLTAHPDWKLNVSGHTDNIGGDDYNLDLSKRRSAAVKAALIANYQVAPARLETDGFGASKPVDTNATLAGRARNRRVELVRQ